MINKEYKIEITRLLLGIIITSIFSLMTISIINFSKTYKQLPIEIKLFEKNIKERDLNFNSLSKNLINIKKLSKKSDKRISIAKLMLNNSFNYSNKERNTISKQITLNLSKVKNDLKKIDFEKKIDFDVITNFNINESFRKVLKQELLFWSSVDFLNIYTIGSMQYKEQIKKIELEKIQLYEYQNTFSSKLEELKRILDSFPNKIKSEKQNFTELKNHLKLIRNLSFTGIILSLILIVPIVIIFWKDLKNVS